MTRNTYDFTPVTSEQYMSDEGRSALSLDLRRAAVPVVSELTARHQLLAVERFGHSRRRAANALQAIQATDGVGIFATQRHFAIVNADGTAVGMAEAIRFASLQSLPSSLPLAVTPSVARRNYPEAGTWLSAWVGEQGATPDESREALVDVYKRLARRCMHDEPVHTLEPVDGPSYAHEALLEAGFRPQGDGRFDDHQGRWETPLVSTLYAGRVVELSGHLAVQARILPLT